MEMMRRLAARDAVLEYWSEPPQDSTLKSPGLIAIFICCALLVPQGFHTTAADRLAAAVQSGTAADVEAQLRQGADPNWRFANGETPLAYAILKERYRIADLLVAHGADPKILDHGISMLSLVVQARTCPAGTVSALLAAGADPNQRDSVSPPLLRALHSGAEACAQALISHGANIEARDAAGGTALHAAVVGSSPKVVEQIIRGGVSVNSTMAQQATPLMWAALRQPGLNVMADAIIAILLDRGADPCMRDAHGMTAADYARKMGFEARASRLATACAARRSDHPRKRHARG